MLRWTPGLRGKDRHVYGCQWLTVRPHWIICLYSKRPPQLALLEALDWVGNFHNFLSSCKPPWGCISNRKNLGWWDLLRVLKLQDCEINQVDLMGQDKMSPESPAWGLHTRTHGSHTKKTLNKNTLENTDTGITQAFNKLFVQVKVDCRPLRKKEGWRAAGEATKGRAGECRDTRATETLIEMNNS